jgi:hypothetical protein
MQPEILMRIGPIFSCSAASAKRSVISWAIGIERAVASEH